MSNTINRFKIRRKRTFELIKNGTKWLEVRLERGIFANIKEDTVLELYNGCDNIRVIVVDIKRVNSIDELINDRLIRIGSTPEVSDKDISKYYRQFYSEGALRRNKVIVLRIKLVS